ncbi:motility associated factor glycosyltransferase family protein [Clostridium beijerinckii]|uniref:Motility associated factor glycosyltransferase family protein n=1 Tax=Clostridium beijerinckii TaxID=1520 RepID=A0A7X9SKF5_CLOBE|nr:6-hydroxymethylpterin diphosphokinase MptE-like protein [Clostridium beijerinckii]NMF03282.1 motility associated factor glycosyltransferase family protein [Clostridium beijerinckii]
MRNIEIAKTRENNFTICVDKIYLHSKYYPFKEAEKFIIENKDIYIDKKYVVVYGLALGYHVIKLLEKLNSNCKVYVFDFDNEVVKKCADIGMLNEIKKDNRVELFLDYSKGFPNKLQEKMNLVEDIIIYKPSLKCLPESYELIKSLFRSYELAKIGIQRFGEIAKENYKYNTNRRNYKISEFYSKYSFKDKPIVIAAGGPSLENTLHTLKSFRDRFYIFALGQTLSILVKNAIKPDAIVIIDPQEDVYELHIKGHEDLDIPLCFLSTASRWVVSNYKGPKYIFFNDKDKNNKDDITINTGKTVAVAALDIAVKSGTDKIILTGQDLAFINNKFHAGDEIESSLYNKSTVKVLGVDGKMLKTTSGMLEFKRNIENIIKDNPKVTFINCSKGARIEGTLEGDLV